MNYQSVITLLLLAAASALPANAQSVHSNFGSIDEDRHLLKVLRLPEIKGDYKVMLRCDVTVEKSGKLDGLGCVNSTEGEYAITMALQTAAKKTRMVPATIDGKPRTVYVQFRAEFFNEGEEHKASLYLNPADPENIEAYGEHHFAAQRVLGKEPWQKICPTRAMWLIYARAYMSPEGHASSVELQHGAGIRPTGNCIQSIIETLENSEYIPTMVDGEAVPSAFIEGFGN